MFIVALFVIAPNLKLPKYSSTVEYYNAKKLLTNTHNMTESHKHNVEQEKSNIKEYTLYVFIHTKFKNWQN